MKEKVAIIDSSSRSLPYDYYYVREIAKSYEIDFYCSTTKYNNEFIEYIARIENINLRSYNISDTNKLKGILNYLSMLLRIFWSQKTYHKVHFIWSIAPLLELPFFGVLRNKMIFTFHNDVPHEQTNHTNWAFNIIYKLSSKVIFVSESVLNRFVENYKITNKKKIELRKHGIMSIDINQNLRIDSSGALKKKLIFWGNVKPYKGVNIFSNLVKDSYFNEFDLEVYGKWDSSLRSLKKELIALGIKVNDNYLSPAKLLELFSVNAIFILPYDKATQSGVLYTLLYYNQIFVSTDNGDNGDFLKESGLGQLIFDAKNLRQLREAIIYCFENSKDIRSKLKTASKEYNWSEILRSPESIYA